MPEQSSRDWVEVLVAIGRIEEGIKSVRDSIDRLDKKSDAQDEAISEMQLDIQKLKTERSTVRENIAIALSIIAVLAAVLAVVRP